MNESDVWNNQVEIKGLRPLLRQMLLRMKFEYDADSFALLAWDRPNDHLSVIVSRPSTLYEAGVPPLAAARHALHKRAVVLGEEFELAGAEDPPCKDLPASAIGLRICKYRLTDGPAEGRRFDLAVPLCDEQSYARRELLSGDFVGVVEFFRPSRPFDDEEAALLLLQGRRLAAVLEHAIKAQPASAKEWGV